MALLELCRDFADQAEIRMKNGKIITFYSYKGGTGRSMSLANVAWILALNGKRVMTIDWDLEAPGLHRYFLPFLSDSELVKTDGLIDLFWSYTDLVLAPKDALPIGVDSPISLADAQIYAVPLEFKFPDNGCLHFLGAGKQSPTYAAQIRNFDWNAFYTRLGGGEFIDSFRQRLIEQYDYILIDSRTGVADTSGISTIQMPDKLVLCFTYNRQNMLGIEAVAKSILEQTSREITLLPVAMRAERSIEGYDRAKQVARNLLEPLLKPQFSPEILELYWDKCEVPHYPDYAFEETLAVFKDTPEQRNTLLNDMTWLAETIVEAPEGSLKIREMESSIRNTFLRHFALNVSGGLQPLNEAKMIIVGRVNVGKTSLVNRLADDVFKPNEYLTQGIRINPWQLSINNEVIKLNIWDFGGQELMHATHQFFLTENSLYLLVLSGREGVEDLDADYWLRLIQAYSQNSPVIIVLNKIKEHPFSIDQAALLRKYPKIRAFVKTDCKDSTGIEELQEIIKREVYQLENLRHLIPASWLAIKQALTTTNKDYISIEEYRRICNQYGETNEDSQNTLATYLHELGIILMFKDDPRLLDIVIVNPSWLTEGIYKILNSPLLARQQGSISLSDLSKVLEKEEYPAHLYHFLLDVMRKFDLCFSFSGEDSRYLIPDLLPEEEPIGIGIFNPEECLNFEYHYSILPKGIILRFIARTHTLNDKMLCWRNGTVLRSEDCQALIRADLQERKIFISIKGRSNARRRLLAIIRSDFDTIHNSLPNLQVSEMIPIPDKPGGIVPYDTLLVLEKNNIEIFPTVINGRVVKLNVRELLNGIDETKQDKLYNANQEQGKEIHLFYSYSHKDEYLRNELETHLKLLQRQGLIQSWTDRQIEVGEEWENKINEKLERADIILLLISADYLASDYCYGVEMARALALHDKGQVIVIPIILRSVNLSNLPFSRIQMLPGDGKAVTSWSDRDSAWRNISEGIERVIEKIRTKNKPN